MTWRVQEGLAGGTVTTAGLYTAPALTGLYHVVATSTLDSTASATAPVQVHGAAISGGVAGTAPVSVADLACLMAAYGTAAGDPRFNVLADLNGDGVIDDQDLVLFLKAFP